MLAIERRREILNRLGVNGKVLVSELSRDFGVTEETIRRDLEKLDAEGLAAKTYGGAVSRQNPALDLPYNVRAGFNVAQKQIISDIVASLIHEGDRVMLDASSTALYVLKRLKEKDRLTVITNSVSILLELADKSDWTVLSTGGALKKGDLSLNGSSAEKMIKSYHVDAVIFSCTGLDGDLGATDSNEANSLIKQAMIASAERRILVADGEKFGKKSFVSICPIDDIDTIVTDREPSAAWVSLCAEKNIELVYRKDAI